MTHIIAEPCVGVKDTACVDVCPVDCIYGKNEDWEMLYIHPEECIDCGLCVDACPVEAIFPLEEVPDKWKEYIAKNYEHFGFDAAVGLRVAEAWRPPRAVAGSGAVGALRRFLERWNLPALSCESRNVRR